MKLLNKLLKSSIRILFILSLLIAIPTAKGEINSVFIPYYDSYMFFVTTSCTDNQYKKNLILTMNFGDLSHQKMDDGKIESLAGLTSSYFYKIQGTNIVMYYADILIDRRNWNIAGNDERIALIYHELMHAYFRYPDLKDKSYAFHFMYYTTSPVPLQKLNEQMVELLGLLCVRP